MSKPPADRRPPRRDEAAWGPSLGFLAIALGLLAGLLFWWWQPSPAEAPPAETPMLMSAAPMASAAAPPQPQPPSAAPPVMAATQPSAAAAPGPRIWRQRDPEGDQTPDLADHVNEGERPGMAEVIARLQAAGVHTGLGAFSPPGTRPPLLGLAVPEDFELPPGYVRHYQATDDGQRIEPILMYSPDRPPLDWQGRPITLPANRVVPAELAPAGLAIRQIVLPAPLDPGQPRP
ncbi:hypothetical protein G8A07_22845 [Roseateles sp. DAIF2]|uniref:hypothetical protein n=1 Tax=Roseateles sp. DAIF2 TaxID=2714952 RepID=UPI0018A2D9A6|nr:hypothetical protein [Roseateles sp. DAIF2]QPF75473.1 hypothetical protein G8A07_22845 [Roseateles sp. DAIF2]